MIIYIYIIKVKTDVILNRFIEHNMKANILA